MSEKMVKCKACGEDIASSAKSCPNCGAKNKKPIYKKWWFYLIILIVLISIGGASGGEDEETNTNQPQQTETQTVENATDNKESATETKEYTVYDVSELVDDLKDNAMKAESKYQGKYVEITGALSVIDSDGKYISLESSANSYDFIDVQCYIKNKEQKARIMELSKGDTLTVKGKITQVGEVLGYQLNIDEIK